MKNKLKQILKKCLLAYYRLLRVCFPVKKKVVLFCSNMGKNYSGNPKGIFLRMRQRSEFDSYRAVWFLNRAFLGKNKNFKIPGARIVCYGTPAYYYYMAVGGTWIFDTRQESYLVKRPSQRYVQTWHGTPLKKLGLDLSEVNMKAEQTEAGKTGKHTAEKTESEIKRAQTEAYRKSITAESAKWDFLISPNRFSSEIFRGCFDFSKTVLETGYPRNDVLLALASETANKSAGNKKTILYAPTWRDDEYIGDGWYSYPAKLDLRLMEKLLKDKFRLFIKLHYLVKLKPGDIPQECIDSGFVTVLAADTDIAEIYPKTDILVTDYSSVMFDYAVLGRPMVFFDYDLEKYRDSLRGFYFDFESEAPGPVVRDTGSLCSEILSQTEAYEKAGRVANERFEAFREKYVSLEDGHASDRVLDAIF